MYRHVYRPPPHPQQLAEHAPLLPASESIFIQEFFRIRLTDNEGLNDAFDGGDPAENANTTISTGIVFRVRFKVRETAGGPDSTGFKLQVNYDGGGYVDVGTGSGDSAPAVITVPSAQFTDGDPTSTERLTSTTTYVNGEGFEDDNTSISYSLTSEETEFEWALMIMNFYDGPNQTAVSDTFTLRVVQADNTVFAGSYTSPTITVAITDFYIGGTFVETPNRVTANDSNGVIYFLMEPSETDNELLLVRSADGGKTWTIGDDAGRPTTTDIEAADMVVDGQTLHIVTRSITSSTERTFYHRYRMSDHATTQDDWEIIDEIITTSAVVHQGCAIEVRSDGSIVAFYTETISSFERVSYKIRNGSWGSATNLDTTASTIFAYVTVVKGASDLIHIFYSDSTAAIGKVWHKSLNSSNTLSAAEEVYADLGTGTNKRGNLTNPVYWDDGGTEKIMIGIIHRANDILRSFVVTDDGVPETEKDASDNTVSANPGGTTSNQIVANFFVDGKIVYLFYANVADDDIYRDEANNDGGWGTDVEFLDGVTTHFIRGHAFTHSSGNGGATVAGFVRDNGSSGRTGFSFWDEYIIAAGTLPAKQTIILQAVNRSNTY